MVVLCFLQTSKQDDIDYGYVNNNFFTSISDILTMGHMEMLNCELHHCTALQLMSSDDLSPFSMFIVEALLLCVNKAALMLLRFHQSERAS